MEEACHAQLQLHRLCAVTCCYLFSCVIAGSMATASQPRSIKITGHRDGKQVGQFEFASDPSGHVPIGTIKEVFGISRVHLDAADGVIVGSNAAGLSNIPFPEVCSVYGPRDKGQPMIVRGPWGPVLWG